MYLRDEIENLNHYLITRQDGEILPTGDTWMDNAMYAILDGVQAEYPTTVEQLRELIRKVGDREQELDHLNGAVGAVFDRLMHLQNVEPYAPILPEESEQSWISSRLSGL